MPANPENMTVAPPSRNLQIGSDDWNAFIDQAVSCDLASPANPCKLVYQVLPPADAAQQIYEFGELELDAQTVIWFAQAGLIQWLQTMYGTERDYGIVPSGVYDCPTAEAMTLYARQLRAAIASDAGVPAPSVEGDAFQMTSLELQHLLSTSAVFTMYVMAGARTGSPEAEAVLVPIPDDKYQPPPIDAACGFTTVIGEGLGEGGVGPVGIEPVGAVVEEEPKTSNLLIWGGLGVGVIGAALFASTFMKKGR